MAFKSVPNPGSHLTGPSEINPGAPTSQGIAQLIECYEVLVKYESDRHCWCLELMFPCLEVEVDSDGGGIVFGQWKMRLI
jgi:hypothetical protein